MKNQIVTCISISLCLACFWSGMAFIAVVTEFLPVMANPTTFAVVFSGMCLLLGLFGASEIQNLWPPLLPS